MDASGPSTPPSTSVLIPTVRIGAGSVLGTCARMAIPTVAHGAQVPKTDPAPIRTVGMRTEVLGGVDGPLASSCECDPRWRGSRSLGTCFRRVLTGVTQRLVDEACKRLGLVG